MAAVDISGVSLIAPVLVYFLVALVTGAVLVKTKVLGENRWVQVFVSLLVATLFISFAGANDYVLTIVPWFAVLLISLFFFLLLMGFVGKSADFMNKGVGVAVLIIFAVILILSAFFVFSNIIVGYFPGPTFGSSGSEPTLLFFSWLYSPRVLGAILLIVVAAATSWILVKGK